MEAGREAGGMSAPANVASGEAEAGGGLRTSRRSRKPSAKMAALGNDSIVRDTSDSKTNDSGATPSEPVKNRERGEATEEEKKEDARASMEVVEGGDGAGGGGKEDGADIKGEATATGPPATDTPARKRQKRLPEVANGTSGGRFRPRPGSQFRSRSPPPHLFRRGPLPPQVPPTQPRTSAPTSFSVPPPTTKRRENPSRGPLSTVHPGIAGVYAHHIRERIVREADPAEMPVVPLPRHVIGGVRDQAPRLRRCNCRKSNCLKLYCECFSAAVLCGWSCTCANCNNHRPSHGSIVQERSKVIDLTLESRPNAFRPKAAAAASTMKPLAGSQLYSSAKAQQAQASQQQPHLPTPEGKHKVAAYVARNVRCDCKKSACLKKYCECFRAMVHCTAGTCGCRRCQNFPGNPEREATMARRLENERREEAASAVVAREKEREKKAAAARGVGLFGESLLNPVTDIGDCTVDADAGGTGALSRDGRETNRAAIALAAAAAKEGVDLTLPPSMYAVPMKLADGTVFPSLAFGTQTASAMKSLAPARPRPPPTRHFYGVAVETELEQTTREAAEQMAARIDYVKTILDRKLAEARGVPSAVGPLAGASCRSVWYRGERSHINTQEVEREAADVVKFVQGGVARTVRAMNLAKRRAQDVTSRGGPVADVGTEAAATSTSNRGAEAPARGDASHPLFCSEILPRVGRTVGHRAGVEGDNPTGSDPVRALVAVAAQDAALLHELARIVREKALELGADRIRRAAEAASMARSAAEALMKEETS